MNRKAIAAIAAVAVAVAAIGIVYAITDDQYDITYVLNGGTQNDLNPTSYEAGTTTELYDPYDDDMVFVSWYLDEAMTEPVVSIGPDISGDITLYAGWSDSVVGKTLEYDVSGSYDSGLLSSYMMDGTVTYRYLYQNESGEFLMSTRIANAGNLLRGSDIPVAEVAKRCGIPNLNNFCRFFKRISGMTPLEFRRKKGVD